MFKEHGVPCWHVIHVEFTYIEARVHWWPVICVEFTYRESRVLWWHAIYIRYTKQTQLMTYYLSRVHLLRLQSRFITHYFCSFHVHRNSFHRLYRAESLSMTRFFKVEFMYTERRVQWWYVYCLEFTEYCTVPASKGLKKQLVWKKQDE